VTPRRGSALREPGSAGEAPGQRRVGRLHVWLVTGVAGALVGCVRLAQPAPSVQDYRIDYAPPVVEGRAPMAVTVRVPPFGVSAIYDRQAMVYRTDTYATGAYVYERWSANPGSMLADLLARDLAASGVYRAVQQGPSILPSDYQLTGQIEEMEERVGPQGCAAHLHVRLLLLRTRATRRDPVVLRASYDEEAECACNDAGALAAAMSRVAERIASQLEHDVYEAIAADQAAGTKP
jgi:uncharacterized lipoprotein YmbA